MNVVKLNGKENPSLIEQADEVLKFLNAKTSRHYSARNPKGVPTANAEYVMCRLKEGYSVQDCRSVIAMKCREWGADDKMYKYLRPETLFRRSNFESYIGEIGPEDGAN